MRKPIPFPTPAEQAAEARRQGYEPDDGKRLSDYGLTASDIEIEAPQKAPRLSTLYDRISAHVWASI